MSHSFDSIADLRRDALLLDRLAAGEQSGQDRDNDVLVDLLVALRDEARAPLPSAVPGPPPSSSPVRMTLVSSVPGRRPRGPGRQRLAAGAVAALLSLPVTGVAAAVSGHQLLEPIRAAIGHVYGDDSRSAEGGTAAQQSAAVRSAVAQRLARAQDAVRMGDAATATAELQEAQALADSVDGPDGGSLALQVAAARVAMEEAGPSDGSTAADGTNTEEIGSEGTASDPTGTDGTGAGEASAADGTEASAQGDATTGPEGSPTTVATPGATATPDATTTPGSGGSPAAADSVGGSDPAGQSASPGATLPHGRSGDDHRSGTTPDGTQPDDAATTSSDSSVPPGTGSVTSPRVWWEQLRGRGDRSRSGSPAPDDSADSADTADSADSADSADASADTTPPSS